MKSTLCLVSLWIATLVLHAVDAPEERVKLYSHVGRSTATNEWWLGASRAGSLPKWNPEQDKEPPLPLAKALEIARKGGDERERLESVAIQSILGADYAPPFNSVFYYAVWFKGGFERRLCVILMDGSILQPIQSPPRRTDPEDIR